MRIGRHPLPILVALVVVFIATPALAVDLTKVSDDPYSNPASQHQTEVEPDTFSSGSTVVSAFQVGRFFNGGSTDIGFATSTNNGGSWTAGFIRGLTFTSGLGGATGAPFERVSDPSVAYDAEHAAWLISLIPLLPDTSTPTVFVNRSTDDGRTWSPPVSIPPPVAKSADLDKNWTVCDNVSTRFRGHCYTELDNFGSGNDMLMSTSSEVGTRGACRSRPPATTRA